MIHTLMALDKVKSACKVNPITMRPTFKAFWTCEGPKSPQHGLKMGPFHPLVHPKWSRMRLGKMRF